MVEPEIETAEDITISVQAKDVDIIERSETISDGIVELYGIDDATTIVIGDEALVGVKIAYDEELNSDTKDMIESTVKSVDKEITNIYLTTLLISLVILIRWLLKFYKGKAMIII